MAELPASISDEVIVITGASGGVGRATAQAFARPGVRIAVLARGERGLHGVGREIEARGGEALIIRADVSDWAQVVAAAQQVHDMWGRIDVWVNNAMATVFGPIDALDPDDLRRVTDVTYLGAAYGTMAALRYMRSRNRGVIVQVGSALAYRAIPLQAAYCAAKHALRGFTDAVRCELLHDRINVHLTMVHLSAFNTPQFDWARNLTGRRAQPVPPIFQPELAARAIVWAARHRRREVFVGWPSVQAVVANKLLPGLLDRILAKSAFSSQLASDPLPGNACENLYGACDVDAGARGRFDERARHHSLQWLVTSHRPVFLWSCVLLVVALTILYATSV